MINISKTKSPEDKPDRSAASDLRRIIQIRHLTDKVFIVRFERAGLKFRPGQRLIIGFDKEPDQREYSIYSGEQDDYLEILVREVENGNISSNLKLSEPGRFLKVNGPFGSFSSGSFSFYRRKPVFIATGTGISPFHSIIKSYSGIDYTLIHGVRYKVEAYESNEYDPRRYFLCTSGETHKNQKCRVTKFIRTFMAEPDMLFYLCGNGSMIYEVWHILRDKGVPDENIFTERYF